MASGRTNVNTDNQEYESAACCKCCTIFGAWSGLQCCCCAYSNDQPFLSIKRERFCTDVPCFLGFLFILLLQSIIVVVALTSDKSEPNRLIYWTNYKAEFCAPDFKYFSLSNNITVAGNYAAWPDIRLKDIRICVDTCDETMQDPRIVTPFFGADLNNIEIDSNTGLAIDISGYKSEKFINIICIPKANISEFISADLYIDYRHFSISTVAGVSEVWNVMFSEFLNTWSLYIICAISAAVLAVLWGWSVMHCGRFIVTLSIIGMTLGLATIAIAFIAISTIVEDYGYEQMSTGFYWCGIILLIIDVMLCFAVCFMYNRILLAIELVKETYRALNSITSMLFYPLLPGIWFCCYMGYWLFGAAAIAAITVTEEDAFPDAYKYSYYKNGPTLQANLDLSDNAVYKTLKFDKAAWGNAARFHFFVLLWMVAFIGYHSYMVVAGVYAEWYFADWTDDKETTKLRGSEQEVATSELDSDIDVSVKLSRSPVSGSFKRVTRYHLGTIAFASLTIAVVTMIEYSLVYLEKKFKNIEQCPLRNVTLRCVQCIIKCMKCIIHRINRDGLIITSLYGWPFCAASTKGITVIVKNVLRAAVLAFVSGYLEWLGKLGVVFFNVAVCVLLAYTVYDVTLILLLCVMCLIVSYCIVWLYLQVYEVGIRVIFICFLIDEERNKDLQKMKCSKRLMKIIGAKKVPRHYVSDMATSEMHSNLIPHEQRTRYALDVQYEGIDDEGREMQDIDPSAPISEDDEAKGNLTNV